MKLVIVLLSFLSFGVMGEIVSEDVEIIEALKNDKVLGADYLVKTDRHGWARLQKCFRKKLPIDGTDKKRKAWFFKLGIRFYGSSLNFDKNKLDEFLTSVEYSGKDACKADVKRIMRSEFSPVQIEFQWNQEDRKNSTFSVQ